MVPHFQILLTSHFFTSWEYRGISSESSWRHFLPWSYATLNHPWRCSIKALYAETLPTKNYTIFNHVYNFDPLTSNRCSLYVVFALILLQTFSYPFLTYLFIERPTLGLDPTQLLRNSSQLLMCCKKDWC